MQHAASAHLFRSPPCQLGYTPACLRRYPGLSSVDLTSRFADTPEASSSGRTAVVVQPTVVTAADPRTSLPGLAAACHRYPVMWVDDAVDVEMSVAALPRNSGEGETVLLRGAVGQKAARFGVDLARTRKPKGGGRVG